MSRALTVTNVPISLVDAKDLAKIAIAVILTPNSTNSVELPVESKRV